MNTYIAGKLINNLKKLKGTGDLHSLKSNESLYHRSLSYILKAIVWKLLIYINGSPVHQ